jgi:two-component system response regulator DevR
MNAPNPTIRVLIVDDSALVREGLRAVIGTHGMRAGLIVVGEAPSVAAGVGEALRLQPDVVLLDIRLPDGSGLEACRKIRRALPATHVLVLTSVATDQLIHEAVSAGAQGYLMKEIDSAALIRAIVDAFAGKSVLTPEITERVMRLLRETPAASGGGLALLSAQERRVLALIAEGRTNKEIGLELELSEKTVKNYLGNVFEKLQVNRRAQAAVYYTQAVGRPSGPNGPSA